MTPEQIAGKKVYFKKLCSESVLVSVVNIRRLIFCREIRKKATVCARNEIMRVE